MQLFTFVYNMVPHWGFFEEKFVAEEMVQRIESPSAASRIEVQ